MAIPFKSVIPYFSLLLLRYHTSGSNEFLQAKLSLDILQVKMQQLGMSGYHFFHISGYMDILDTDFFGYLDNWILGYHAYLDTRILGYMDIHFLWIHGYLDTLDIKFFHYPDFGYPIQVSGYFWILF